jgi:acetyltransferase-like isoleucine patch superfamily enzyme
MFDFIYQSIKLEKFRKKWRNKNPHNYTIANNLFDYQKIVVGRKTYGYLNITDYSEADTKVYIGSYCSIAPGVQFLLGGEHQLHSLSTYPFKTMNFGYVKEAGSKGDITVADDVWIGTNAIICSGITIDQGAVIAAGAVVTRNVPAYAIVGGNPARIIKYRFAQEIIQYLQETDLARLFDSFTSRQLDTIYQTLDTDTYQEILQKLGVSHE